MVKVNKNILYIVYFHLIRTQYAQMLHQGILCVYNTEFIRISGNEKFDMIKKENLHEQIFKIALNRIKKLG